jgi:two-component system, sensor histidine kinase YesM
MKCRFRKQKLRNQLALLIGVSIFMMIILQVFFFTQFYSIMRQKTKVYTLNTINQVGEILVSNLRDTKKAAMTVSYSSAVQDYLNSKNVQKKMNLHAYLNDIMKYTATSNESISEIVIIDCEGHLTSMVSSYDYWIYDEYKKNMQAKEKGELKPFYSLLTKDYYAYFIPFYNISFNADPYKSGGTCIIVCKTSYLQNTIDKIAMPGNSFFVILDNDNKIVASNKEQMNGSRFKFDVLNKDNNTEDTFEYLYNDVKSIVQYKTVEETKWKIVSIVPVSGMINDITPIMIFGICMGIAMALILLVIGVLFINSITRPISRIIEFLGEVGEKNLKHRLKINEVNQANEVGQITIYINGMMDKIEDMTSSIINTQANLYEMEIEKKHAELNALQNQINPHFLYNTLECMRSIGLAYHSAEIVKISTAMADIFRYSIKGAEFVRVEEEMVCVSNYLEIMSIRSGGKYLVYTKVDSEVKKLIILKMILQPVVENAIYHGLEHKLEKGKLLITGYIKDEDTVCFEISDDGKGMSEKELEKLVFSLKSCINSNIEKSTEKRSIGLININRRIKLLYGEKYGIIVKSRKEVGTSVILSLPAQKQQPGFIKGNN